MQGKCSNVTDLIFGGLVIAKGCEAHNLFSIANRLAVLSFMKFNERLSAKPLIDCLFITPRTMPVTCGKQLENSDVRNLM